MLDNIVDSEEIRSDKKFPDVMMIVVIGSKDEVDDVNNKSLDDDSCDKVAY